MKNFFNSIKIAVLALCCLWSIQGSAQLQVNNAVTATDLANQIVGSGVTVSNAQILGAPNGFGIFSDGNTTNIGLTNGVLLTTGNTSEASGNAGGNDASTNVSSIYHGDADLASISGWDIQDACVLTFDFVAESDQITVQYVFSSEEYNEYVCSQFNDVFGFFVSGPNPLGGSYASQNIALVPSSSLPVSINTINNGNSGSNGSAGNCQSLANSAYYIDNAGGTTIEYDGFTVVLTAVINIVPGETYSFKFAIADVSDGILDSGVFIKGSSLSVFLCQAGNLSFLSPTNGLVCSNDDIADVVSVSTSSIADGDTYAFLLTSTTGEILAMNSTGTFDLSSYADGQFLVYGLSYDGIVSVPSVGGNIADLSAAGDEGCFELTSPLTVAKTECTEAPSLACPSSVSIQCLSDIPAADAASVLVFATQCEAGAAEWVNDVPEGNSCSGVIIRTYSATDDCGNTGYCTQSIYYLDTEAPFLVTAEAEVSIECGQEDMIPSITVGDYCDEMVEVSHEDMNIVEEGCNRSFERVYTFTDNCGNTGSFTQYVSVGDNTAPIIHGVEEVINVQCIDELPAAAEAFATDNCDENLEVLVFGAATGNTTSECVLSTAFGPGADWSFWTPSLFEAGITSSSNFHFDSNGGRFDQFGDGSAHLYGTVVNSVNSNETFALDMWFENAADWNTWSAMGRNYKDDLNCATPSQLFEDWTYYEMVNNLSVAVGGGDLNGVLLQFQHMPVNKYFGFQIGQGANNKNCGDGLSGWFYYTGFDNCEPISGHGDINVDVECEPSNEENICSTEYSYIYSTVDASGNYSSIVQTIVIEDTTAPEFAYCPESVSVQCSSDVPAAATDLSATDNCGGEVSIVALPELIEGNFPCNYVITRTWIAEDNCGNRTNCVQTISVQDTQAPEFIYVPVNLTVECSDEVPAVNATASDNCGDATVSYADSFEGNSCYGVITRVFTAVDACGNENYATQYITIEDTTAPVFVEFDNTIQVECDQIETLQPLAATDNCNEVTVTFTEVHNSGGCLGVLERTYTATDLCGNSATVVQYITIIDTTAPVINTPVDQTVECDNVPAMEIPTAYDNCGQEVTVTGSEEIIAGDCANSYTIVRTWVAIDYCENVATSNTTIIVVDTTSPTWEFVPADSTILCDQEIPAVQMAIAIDNCDDNVEVAVTEEVSAGNCPQASTITRIFRGFDNCGNEVMAVQHIYIVDTIAPVWNYETAISELTFECDEVVAGVEPVAFDNCGLINIAVAETLYVQSSCYSVGAFIYTATDECGNVSAPFYQYYYIVDTTAPVFNQFSIEIDRPCDNYEGVFVSATDNCNEVEITYSDEHVSGGCQGRIIRNYMAVDACQNVSYAQQIITLTDETAPVVVEQPTDMSYECSNNEWSYAEVSFTDNCAEEISVDFNVAYTPNGCLGFYTATWTAVDNCGNTTVVDQVITIVDTIDPQFTYVPVGYTAECSEELVLANATASDDCSNATVTVTEETIAGNCPNTYTLVRTFTATDNCGNTDTATQEIIVADNTAPVWNYETAVSELSFECDEVVASIQPTATDNCNVVEYMVAETLYVSGSCYTSGAFIFTAVDACGNESAPFYQYFTIVDTTAPVVAPYDVEVDMPCDQVNGNALITATDNCNEVTITFTDEYVSGGCQGRIIRDYTITDACENTTYAQQIITLIDVVAPMADVLPENLEIECGSEIPGFIPSWSDNCDDELALSAISGISMDGCNEIISRSWTAVDNCGNTTTISQMITIVDTTAPEFEYVPADYTAECSSELSFEMAYAWDICDENVTVDVTEETIEGSCAGNYTIVRTFTATDACGNFTAEEQTIIVEDTTAPEFTYVPYGGQFSCENGIDFGMATATDLCSDATVTFEDDYSYYCANSYSVVRTWTATDACGNFTTANSYYSVYDYTAPTFDAQVSNVSVECASEIPAFVELTATDNCGTATVTRTEEVLSNDDCGNQVIEVTYVAVDDCGNENYTSYTITVLDETAPVLSSNPASVVLACDQAIPAAEVVTALDNCNGEVQVMYTESYIGEQPEEGSIADCDLLTPALPAGNPCGYPTAWAMALFNMPSAHRFYVVQSGELVQFANGTQHLVATLVNAYNPNAGFNVDVTFANAQDWASWSSQNFPTSFKADCGGEGANHFDWVYSILQNGPGAELTGWGAYAGSSINLTHAPSSNYFGFQLGDGANNYNGGDNGFGGWFTYNGTFVNGTNVGTTPTTSNVNGGGDFAFELDCCPDYQVVRCWTAMDCSGNTAEYCQTISFEGSTVTPAIAVETATTTVADSKESMIEVYPNPAVDQATFIFKAAESGKTMIEIYDLAGARIAMIYSNVVEAGTEYRTTYDASNLATGVYMYRMTNGSTSEMGRMIINK